MENKTDEEIRVVEMLEDEEKPDFASANVCSSSPTVPRLEFVITNFRSILFLIVCFFICLYVIVLFGTAIHKGESLEGKVAHVYQLYNNISRVFPMYNLPLANEE
jgi:ABC-type multidrug transport system permease subunit